MYLGILPEEWVTRYQEAGAVLPNETLYVELDELGRAIYIDGEMMLMTFTLQQFNQFRRSGQCEGILDDWQLLYARHKWCSIHDDLLKLNQVKSIE